jgi:hypothetical protein
MRVVERKESQRGAMHDNGMLRAALSVLSSCTASSLAPLISLAIPLLFVLSDAHLAHVSVSQEQACCDFLSLCIS